MTAPFRPTSTPDINRITGGNRLRRNRRPLRPSVPPNSACRAIKATPNALLAEGTDWRFFNELRRELKG